MKTILKLAFISLLILASFSSCTPSVLNMEESTVVVNYLDGKIDTLSVVAPKAANMYLDKGDFVVFCPRKGSGSSYVTFASFVKTYKIIKVKEIQ